MGIRRLRLTQPRSGGRYVPPYDSKEKHLPGYNYCGPGTNVTRRMSEGVQPVNELDAACQAHDIDIEERGPKRRAGSAKEIRASDSRLARAAKAIALKTRDAELRANAWLVHRAMKFNRWRKSRRD
ncbi:hypothetical protein N8951_00730 [bacterium]|nr:hypothetical protein [bacterium]